MGVLLLLAAEKDSGEADGETGGVGIFLASIKGEDMFSNASSILFAVWLVTPLLPAVETGFGLITFLTGCGASPSVEEFVLTLLYPDECNEDAPPNDVFPR